MMKFSILILFTIYAATYLAQANPLTVHVLDAQSGINAANMTCKLYNQTDEDEFELITTMDTDANGRIIFLSEPDFVAGTYRIWFGTRDYYDALDIQTFFPGVQVTFIVNNLSLDFHVVVVLSPYGAQTYRGG